MTTTTEALAREAGCSPPGRDRNYWAVLDPAMVSFAAAVAARCARIVETHDAMGSGIIRPVLAGAIRAEFPPSP